MRLQKTMTYRTCDDDMKVSMWRQVQVFENYGGLKSMKEFQSFTLYQLPRINLDRLTLGFMHCTVTFCLIIFVSGEIFPTSYVVNNFN